MTTTSKLIPPFLLIPLLALSLPVLANDEEVIAAHRQMLLEKFPGARFTEFEIDDYKGQEVFEYEFEFMGKDYEAFITREGKILRLGLD